MMLCASLFVQAQELSVGAPMPSFKLNSTVYGKVNSADLKGKVVLISMFATWCGPCQLELAEVEKTLWPKYKDNKNFKLLVIGREHTDADLTKYNERKKFIYELKKILPNHFKNDINMAAFYVKMEALRNGFLTYSDYTSFEPTNLRTLLYSKQPWILNIFFIIRSFFQRGA
jgi:thiol-disulfide isomerase/thioredoxin